MMTLLTHSLSLFLSLFPSDRMIEIYDSHCVPIFEGSTSWPCHFLNTNKTAYLITFTASAHRPPCCIFQQPFYPPPPNFLDNVPYNGTSLLAGRTVNWWGFPGPAVSSHLKQFWVTVSQHTHTQTNLPSLSSPALFRMASLKTKSPLPFGSLLRPAGPPKYVLYSRIEYNRRVNLISKSSLSLFF